MRAQMRLLTYRWSTALGAKHAIQSPAILQEAVSKAEERQHELLESIRAASKGAGAQSSARGQASSRLARQRAGPPGTMHWSSRNAEVVPDRGANLGLAEVLHSISIRQEVLVAISSIHVQEMLLLWAAQVQRVGIQNYLIIAVDEETERVCKEHTIPVYRRDALVGGQKVEGWNSHAVSGSKFSLLRDFLLLGYSVLLSDIDIVFLQNPFDEPWLRRDSDVEGMTDGTTNATAYGWDDVYREGEGEPPFPASHTMRIFVFNSGLFYIRPTAPAVELLDRVAARLAADKDAWDQAVYNEEMFFPSSPGYAGLHLSKRTLDYLRFMNSKVLFKRVRKDPALYGSLRPVSIHVNYHPDKEERMRAIIRRYVHGELNALDAFPDGSQ